MEAVTTADSRAPGWQPVAWTPEREQRGRVPDRGTYRCPEDGCLVVSASLRVLVAHVKAHREPGQAEAEARAITEARRRDTMRRIQARLPRSQAAAEELAARAGLASAAAAALPPEPPVLACFLRTRDRPPPPKMRRAMAALLCDPRRPDPVIGAEAGGSKHVAWRARHELEAAGLIAPYRALPPRGREPGPPGPERLAVIAALTADPERSSREIAQAAGVSKTLAGNVRRDLEAAGVISWWRDPRTPFSSAPAAAVSAFAGLASAASTAPSLTPAVSAFAGLASAAGTAPAAVPAVAAAAVRRCPSPRHDGERVLPASAFYLNRVTGGRTSWCRECMREAKREQRRDERAELARYRELLAAAAVLVPWPPVPPASAAAVTTTARSMATVSG